MALFLNFEKWFPSVTFEKISVLDSYFKHGHIIIKYRSSLILGEIHQLFLELWSYFNVEKLLKNGFCSISFEEISVLESKFIHMYKKNGFRSITIENISEFYSSFIRVYN